jgi:hypothetical protein
VQHLISVDPEGVQRIPGIDTETSNPEYTQRKACWAPSGIYENVESRLLERIFGHLWLKTSASIRELSFDQMQPTNPYFINILNIASNRFPYGGLNKNRPLKRA